MGANGATGLAGLVRLAAYVASAPAAGVTVTRRTRVELVAGLGLTLGEAPAAGMICRWVADHGEPVVVGDLGRDTRFCGAPLVVGPPYLRAYAGLPVVHDDARAVLFVADTVEREFADATVPMLSIVAEQVANELELREPACKVAGSRARLELPDDVVVDVERRTVTWRGAPVALTRREFDLLVHLAAHAPRVCTKDELLEHVWHSSAEYQQARTVSEHVHRLRAKIPPLPIVTVHGVGYRVVPSSSPSGVRGLTEDVSAEAP